MPPEGQALSVVVQRIKPPPAMWCLLWVSVYVLAAPLAIQLPANTSQKATESGASFIPALG